MLTKILSITCLLLIISVSSCSNHQQEISEHEVKFNQVADSLVKYKSGLEDLNKQSDKKLKDYTILSYRSFKEKYHLSDIEMDELNAAYTITYLIARTSTMIDQNTQSFKILDSLNTEKETTRYSYLPDSSKQENKQKNIDQSELLKRAMDGEYK
jgi:hypothetical protein